MKQLRLPLLIAAAAVILAGFVTSVAAPLTTSQSVTATATGTTTATTATTAQATTTSAAAATSAISTLTLTKSATAAAASNTTLASHTFHVGDSIPQPSSSSLSNNNSTAGNDTALSNDSSDDDSPPPPGYIAALTVAVTVCAILSIIASAITIVLTYLLYRQRKDIYKRVYFRTAGWIALADLGIGVIECLQYHVLGDDRHIVGCTIAFILMQFCTIWSMFLSSTVAWHMQQRYLSGRSLIEAMTTYHNTFIERHPIALTAGAASVFALSYAIGFKCYWDPTALVVRVGLDWDLPNELLIRNWLFSFLPIVAGIGYCVAVLLLVVIKLVRHQTRFRKELDSIETQNRKRMLSDVGIEPLDDNDEDEKQQQQQQYQQQQQSDQRTSKSILAWAYIWRRMITTARVIFTRQRASSLKVYNQQTVEASHNMNDQHNCTSAGAGDMEATSNTLQEHRTTAHSRIIRRILLIPLVPVITMLGRILYNTTSGPDDSVHRTVFKIWSQIGPAAQGLLNLGVFMLNPAINSAWNSLKEDLLLKYGRPRNVIRFHVMTGHGGGDGGGGGAGGYEGHDGDISAAAAAAGNGGYYVFDHTVADGVIDENIAAILAQQQLQQHHSQQMRMKQARNRGFSQSGSFLAGHDDLQLTRSTANSSRAT
ncbi:hypothetical protein GQ42DRAFT_155674 [Ramicandelaber brevisporus]|nr:hypothetical protein GQ42DRAFT_155674 [Ramicandelaber brevisporus]